MYYLQISVVRHVPTIRTDSQVDQHNQHNTDRSPPPMLLTAIVFYLEKQQQLYKWDAIKPI
jgi:hypothetical protein